MGALDGLRVIDFGQWIAGPLAAMLLADQGAEVIRVDPREGPRWDTPANAVWNRGKQRIALDLKQSADRRTAAEQLIASADLVIENFRPGVMDRLGLGAEQMTARDDRLIYLSLPGFGSTDERRDIAAWEGVMSAGVGHLLNAVDGRRRTPRPVLYRGADRLGLWGVRGRYGGGDGAGGAGARRSGAADRVAAARRAISGNRDSRTALP